MDCNVEEVFIGQGIAIEEMGHADFKAGRKSRLALSSQDASQID